MVTNPMQSFQRNSCLPRDAVGKAALHMGPDVNESSNRQVYADARSITLPELRRTVNETFILEQLAAGRFSYPKPSGFGVWQVHVESSQDGGRVLPSDFSGCTKIFRMSLRAGQLTSKSFLSRRSIMSREIFRYFAKLLDQLRFGRCRHG